MSKNLILLFVLFSQILLISCSVNFKVETDKNVPPQNLYFKRQMVAPDSSSTNPKPFTLFSIPSSVNKKVLSLTFKSEDEGSVDYISSLPNNGNATLDYNLTPKNIIQVSQYLTNLTIGTRTTFNTLNTKNDVPVYIQPEQKYTLLPTQFSFIKYLLQNPKVKPYCVPNFQYDVGYLFCNKKILGEQIDLIKIAFGLKYTLFIDVNKMFYDGEYLTGKKDNLVLGIVEDREINNVKIILGANFLKQFGIYFDTENKKVVLTSQKGGCCCKKCWIIGGVVLLAVVILAYVFCKKRGKCEKDKKKDGETGTELVDKKDKKDGGEETV